MIIFHEDEHHQFDGNPNITFDNVAVIRFFSVSGNKKQNHKVTMSSPLIIHIHHFHRRCYHRQYRHCRCCLCYYRCHIS